MPASDLTAAPARHVVLVAFDGFQLLDLAGPLEVFAGADVAAGGGVYRTTVATPVASASSTPRPAPGLRPPGRHHP